MSRKDPSVSTVPSDSGRNACSQATAFAKLSESRRKAILADLTPRQLEELDHDWLFWARPNQLPPPGTWATWLVLAGRGFGKTRTGAEYIRSRVEGDTPLGAPPGGARRIALIAETAADARDVLVEGDSGILACSPRWCRPLYEPSKRRLTWPNGVAATLFNAVEPDQLRGPQFDLAWGDEIAKWRYGQDTYDNLQFGLRLGERPKQVFTTTPRPIKLLREILAGPNTVITRGSSLDNGPNLAPTFLASVIGKYHGTRLGRQELDAEMLEDVAGALWTRASIDAARVKTAPDLARIVVAIDPATTSGEDADETGIVVAGVDRAGHGYVLEDLSCREGPAEWARRAIAAYRRHHADRIIAEVNNGGEMVEATLRMVDGAVSFRAVHASRGKVVRAEPVAALYEQGRVRHVGSLSHLEDQMCAFATDFDPRRAGFSPDRVDALVWAFTDLMVQTNTGLLDYYRNKAAKVEQARVHKSGTDVRLKAPYGITTVYGRNGGQHTVGNDGIVVVPVEDVPSMLAAGFTRT